MYLQSILVYLALMSLMTLFALSAISKGSYDLTDDGAIKYKSFWRLDTIALLILFAVVFGMRYDVGTDHLTYLDGYLMQKHIGKNEPVFFLFSEIGWLFNLHYTVYFGALAFVQAFFFFYAFKNERFLYPLLAFFIFTNGEVFFWMNGIRQAMAMCIWIYSLHYIDEKKLTHYLIWGVVSFLIHKSAIILFIFYPILHNGKDYFKSIPLQLTVFVSAFIIKNLFFQVIMKFESFINFYISFLGNDMYQSYGIENLVKGLAEEGGTGIAYMFRIGFNVLVIFFSAKLKEFYNSRWFNIVYFFFFIGLITFYMFPKGAILFTRPFRYFYIFQSIIYSYLGYYLYRKRSDGLMFLILFIMLVGFLGIFLLSQYASNEDSHSLYRFYFQYNIYGYPHLK